MTDVDTGLNVWQMTSNHNRMIELQRNLPQPQEGDVELAFFGSSAFRITSPGGISIMIDPWRNLPNRSWDWYFHDFPMTTVDIGVSTHAHFDHDALHRLDAHVLLDRLIGTYQFGDVTITGIADKHATDSSFAVYDFKKVLKHFHGVDVEPPNNPRSWDHCLIIVETGGMRFLHWGDNRHNPPEEIWEQIGDIDVVFMPVDGSQHVKGFERVAEITDRLKPKVVVPHHYYSWEIVQRQSTLQVADKWIEAQETVEHIGAATKIYRRTEIERLDATVHYFGDHVAFDHVAWLRDGK